MAPTLVLYRRPYKGHGLTVYLPVRVDNAKYVGRTKGTAAFLFFCGCVPRLDNPQKLARQRYGTIRCDDRYLEIQSNGIFRHGETPLVFGVLCVHCFDAVHRWLWMAPIDKV